jgi:hypothetical protein
VIVEDEYIGDMVGTQNFATIAYPINIGQATTFPWGSKIAALYEKYEFERLEFYYKPVVNAFASQGGFGKVMLSALYDALGTPPATKQQVEDSVPHADCMPYEEVQLRLDPKQLKGLMGGKYVRPGAQPANTDLRVYDGGTFYFSTSGFSATSIGTSIGELRVRYRVRVNTPLLEAAAVAGGVIHYSSIAATTANNFAGGSFVSGGSVNLSNISVGTNQIVFPQGVPGNYLLALQVQGATSAAALAVSSVGAASALNLLTSVTKDAVSSVPSLAGTTTNAAMLLWTVTIPVAGATLTLTPSTIVGTGYMDMFIVSLPTSLITRGVKDDVASRIDQMELMFKAIERRVRIIADDYEAGYDEAKEAIPTPPASASSALTSSKKRSAALLS